MPEPVELPNYYIESSTDGILDEEAAQTLCKYLWSSLAPKDYCGIDVLADIANRDPETGEMTWCYAVEVFAQDKAPIDKLLQDYHGPWAPVYFVPAAFSRVDLVQAEVDMNDFLDEHPDIRVAAVNRADGDMVVYVETIEPSDELTAFVEEYPVQGVYNVFEYFTTDLNPD